MVFLLSPSEYGFSFLRCPTEKNKAKIKLLNKTEADICSCVYYLFFVSFQFLHVFTVLPVQENLQVQVSPFFFFFFLPGALIYIHAVVHNQEKNM